MKPATHVALAFALLGAALPSFAQQVIAAKSGLLNYAEGDVTINGAPADLSGVHFSDIKENAVLRTAEGRAEVLLTPGVVLRLGENSSIRMISNRLIDTRLELLSGSAVVEADQIAKDTNVTIVCKEGVVTLPKAGLYRFDAEPAQLKVFKGDADVDLNGNTTTVSADHMIALSSDATVAKFDPEDTDALDRWSHRRGSYLAMANTSAANALMNSNTGTSVGGYGMGYGAYGLGYGFGGYGLGLGLGAYPMAGWGMAGCNSAWMWNMYYNMMTFMPCYGSLWSPYGYQFWSPYTIGRFAGYAPALYGGGFSRTGATGSGAASLARPVATASSRSLSPGAFGSRGAFANGAGGRVGAVSSGSSGGFAGGGGFGGGGGGFGGAGGGHAGAGGGGAGGHGGGGGGHGR